MVIYIYKCNPKKKKKKKNDYLSGAFYNFLPIRFYLFLGGVRYNYLPVPKISKLIHVSDNI